jgi:hypothetical protein
MPIQKDQDLLHYRITEKIGEGGMGEVWKATDTTLDRAVAIKVLPPQLAAHPERLARFDREAKLLATLNHPNIAAIYGFHDHRDIRFVVMELIDGEDLSRRIERGPLPIPDALETATQIAQALAAAHDRGVIHRDLKPANVRLTPDGIVKVLDFGLAKSLEADASASGGDPSASPTMTSGGTAFGVILGTAAYMSPEQARGKPVDRRADLWAFGCVLYEMLTGNRAFEGETVTDTLSAVISREPDWDRLPDDTPAATRRLLRRCLEKKLAVRLRDAADARLELLEPDEPASGATATSSGAPTGRRSWLGLAGAALLGAAVVGAAWMFDTPPPPVASIGPLPPIRQVTFTGEVIDPGAFGSQLAGIDMAADGRTVVYMTRDRSRAILIDLDGGGSQTLFTAEPGTSLFDVAWSPDGGRVYLMTWPYAEHVLSVPRFGGEPRPELDLRRLVGLNGIFVRKLGDDRWLVVGDHNTLYIGRDPGGLDARGTQLHGEGVFRIEGLNELGRIALSSDARHIAFRGIGTDGSERSGVTDAGGKSEFVAAWTGLAPVGWTEDDRTLYLWRETGNDVGDLLRVAIDPSTGQPTSAPELVSPRLTARSVLVSANGKRLILSAGDRVSNLRELTLDGTPDPSDNPTRARTQGTGQWEIRQILDEGTLLAGLVGDLGWELFTVSDDDVHRSLVRLERRPRAGAASRDGDAIALGVERPAPAVLIHDVSDNRSRTIPIPEAISAVDWSPDGKHLAAMTTSSADRMVVVDVESGEARSVTLECGDQCEFAAEGIRFGPEWPYAAVTSEVDTWVVNVETGQLRHVATDTWTIVAWQDSFIYFARGGGQTDWPGYVLFRVPEEGGAEERLLDLPLDCDDYEIDRTGRQLICNADESRLDLQLVDGLGG